jgi:hypothetical protein
MNEMTVQQPAMIISAQKTHRQPALLETILRTGMVKISVS